MDEPPAKRARRTDSAATRDDKYQRSTRDNASPAPSSPRPSDRDAKPRDRHQELRNGNSSTSRSEDRRRQRSRSPRHERERERHDNRRRSRSPRAAGDREYRDRNSGRQHRDQYHDMSRSTRDHPRSDRKRSRSRSHSRSRSRSPYRNGTTATEPSSVTSRSRPQPSNHKHDSRALKPDSSTRPVKRETDSRGKMDIDNDDTDDNDALLKKIMGFSSFKSTQNTKVPGNQIYGVRKEKKSEYRQYMNRVGGFNRPLSPGR